MKTLEIGGTGLKAKNMLNWYPEFPSFKCGLEQVIREMKETKK